MQGKVLVAGFMVASAIAPAASPTTTPVVWQSAGTNTIAKSGGVGTAWWIIYRHVGDRSASADQV